MNFFNNHSTSGLRGLPCFAEGIYWATGLSLTTPFTEGCPGVNNKASPPGRHQEQAPKQRCTFSSTTFSSVQLSVDHGPAHLNSLANTYYQTCPVITMTASLLTTHWGRVPSVHRIYYPASAWLIQFRAYAMPSFPCPRLHY